MKYLQPTFSAPTSNGKITQTDYEIAVGLRHPNGRLVVPTPKCGHVLTVPMCIHCHRAAMRKSR